MTDRIDHLVLVTSRYPFGTQESYLSAELAELRRYFDRLTILPVHPPRTSAAHPVPFGVQVLAWPLIGPRLLVGAISAVVRHPKSALHALRRLTKSRDPGRLKNFAVAIKALALADWAEKNRVSHIHAYWISTPATVAMLAAGLSNAKWSVTAHRWDIYERNAFDIKERSVAFVRTISARGSTDLAARMPSLNGRIIQIGLGTILPKVPAALPNGNGAFNIVCPAALVAVKGHDVLFAALAQLRWWRIPVHCTLCGTGPLRKRLEALCAELGLSQTVEFAGFVAQQRLLQWYSEGRFAAVVLPSRDAGERMMEGIPSALLEAMAFGVPVVATKSGSIGELVDNGCARVVPPGDWNLLARALRDCYYHPRGARTRAELARERVVAGHDVRNQMNKLASLICKG
ncbi:MAG: glycosyltransferase family 4 protein [Candidatus Eremiobacteraeota bacterium]|nr:glycosyltransferase family 4 protein [Candidatus Eremiobacteraeota bacterium]MBV9055382.1 glycosyltransferase family 4 protein [Candidatus Eremiobacteraeota bacterium]MBV9700189.1 glycosyltransferase family 4 protein [Candidatus Eremiobacteraeota bacterium]